jgi:hypothetical protein
MFPKSPVTGEINPYEPPTEAGGYDSRSHAGVGAWRDGEHLVVHPDAVLPPFCIKTGQAAERTILYKLHRSFVLDRTTRRLTLNVPVSQVGYRLYTSAWRKAALSTVVGGVALVLLLLVLSNGTLINIARYGTFVWTVGLAARSIFLWDLLQFVRARSPYLWLSGANPRFLQQLPDWTFGH